MIPQRFVATPSADFGVSATRRLRGCHEAAHPLFPNATLRV
jgi:hypothetical protein